MGIIIIVVGIGSLGRGGRRIVVGVFGAGVRRAAVLGKIVIGVSVTVVSRSLPWLSVKTKPRLALARRARA
jgi:hypothetical protein